MTGRCVNVADILDDGGAFINGGPQPGDYWKQRGQWYAVVPNGLFANLKNHRVVEEADGTITVTPSIRTSRANGSEEWHGYLTHGVWASC